MKDMYSSYLGGLLQGILTEGKGFPVGCHKLKEDESETSRKRFLKRHFKRR